ncbi:MAG TPA: FUN14 domain-containing protein [Nitrososphaeraceae archaeon]|nr:FUN14 domain-containing protein [Nitrososphaeraceae archaeon]
MSFDNISSYAATLGGGFFVGIVIGYAVKKVIKIVAVIVGLFLAGLAYLQSQQIASINWNKLQTVSEGALATVANLTMQTPGISASSSDIHAAATASIAMTSFGIPLTGSMSAGFTIGFFKG